MLAFQRHCSSKTVFSVNSPSLAHVKQGCQVAFEDLRANKESDLLFMIEGSKVTNPLHSIIMHELA
jgi:hypothetical protein